MQLQLQFVLLAIFIFVTLTGADDKFGSIGSSPTLKSGFERIQRHLQFYRVGPPPKIGYRNSANIGPTKTPLPPDRQPTSAGDPVGSVDAFEGRSLEETLLKWERLIDGNRVSVNVEEFEELVQPSWSSQQLVDVEVERTAHLQPDIDTSSKSSIVSVASRHTKTPSVRRQLAHSGNYHSSSVSPSCSSQVSVKTPTARRATEAHAHHQAAARHALHMGTAMQSTRRQLRAHHHVHRMARQLSRVRIHPRPHCVHRAPIRRSWVHTAMRSLGLSTMDNKYRCMFVVERRKARVMRGVPQCDKGMRRNDRGGCDHELLCRRNRRWFNMGMRCDEEMVCKYRGLRRKDGSACIEPCRRGLEREDATDASSDCVRYDHVVYSV